MSHSWFVPDGLVNPQQSDHSHPTFSRTLPAADKPGGEAAGVPAKARSMVLLRTGHHHHAPLKSPATRPTRPDLKHQVKGEMSGLVAHSLFMWKHMMCVYPSCGGRRNQVRTSCICSVTSEFHRNVGPITRSILREILSARTGVYLGSVIGGIFLFSNARSFFFVQVLVIFMQDLGLCIVQIPFDHFYQTICSH